MGKWTWHAKATDFYCTFTQCNSHECSNWHFCFALFSFVMHLIENRCNPQKNSCRCVECFWITHHFLGSFQKCALLNGYLRTDGHFDEWSRQELHDDWNRCFSIYFFGQIVNKHFILASAGEVVIVRFFRRAAKPIKHLEPWCLVIRLRWWMIIAFHQSARGIGL